MFTDAGPDRVRRGPLRAWRGLARVRRGQLRARRVSHAYGELSHGYGEVSQAAARWPYGGCSGDSPLVACLRDRCRAVRDAPGRPFPGRRVLVSGRGECLGRGEPRRTDRRIHARRHPDHHGTAHTRPEHGERDAGPPAQGAGATFILRFPRTGGARPSRSIGCADRVREVTTTSTPTAWRRFAGRPAAPARRRHPGPRAGSGSLTGGRRAAGPRPPSPRRCGSRCSEPSPAPGSRVPGPS